MGGKYVETLKSVVYSYACSLVTQSFAFFVNSTEAITQLRICPCQKTHFQGKIVSEIDR